MEKDLFQKNLNFTKSSKSRRHLNCDLHQPPTPDPQLSVTEALSQGGMAKELGSLPHPVFTCRLGDLHHLWRGENSEAPSFLPRLACREDV